MYRVAYYTHAHVVLRVSLFGKRLDKDLRRRLQSALDEHNSNVVPHIMRMRIPRTIVRAHSAMLAHTNAIQMQNEY